jgi:hypothetical protein
VRTALDRTTATQARPFAEGKALIVHGLSVHGGDASWPDECPFPLRTACIAMEGGSRRLGEAAGETSCSPSHFPERTDAFSCLAARRTLT